MIKKALQEVKDPKRLDPSHPGRQLNSVWTQCSIDSSGLIIIDGKKIFIPKNYRKDILSKIHIAHCGTNKTVSLAKDLYFWRGMATEIKEVVSTCDVCKPYLASQAQEPIIAGTSATGPMTDLGSDLFQIGHNYYLVIVDRYSGFPFVDKLTSLSTSAILKIFEGYFNLFGWPERIRSDNGPQYRSEFDDFCQKHGIIHENSSPHFPQSNGLAESCVKNMKILMKKCQENLKEFNLRLLEWRNTPNSSGSSPAQMFYGRRFRTQLPTLPGATNLDVNNAINAGNIRKNILASTPGKTNQPLSKLQVGQRVIVQHPQTHRWDTYGIVREIRPNHRSYIIQQDDGRTWCRNRRFLRPCSNENSVSQPDSDTSNNSPSKKLRRSTRLQNKAISS